MTRLRRYGTSVLGAAAAGVAAAVLLVVALAIVDMYLSGHGRPTLGRQWIDVPEWGISLSRADVILLAGVSIAAVAAGFVCGKRQP